MISKGQLSSSESRISRTTGRIRTLISFTLFTVFAGLLVSGTWQSSYLATLHLGWKHRHDESQTVRDYSLTLGARWMNPDGGRWRVMLVCNGESPCPTLFAEEGDIVRLHIQNDLGFQSSIHWSGVHHRRMGSWNDGTGGLTQYPTLPRGNWTSIYDTSGYWGLNWYAEHTSAGAVDGLYGMAYVAPSPSRPRPYDQIVADPIELRDIIEAERNIQHMAIKNHQHRGTDWKIQRMRAEGSEFYCYDSILVNGHGRVHCRQPGYEQLKGHAIDEKGCIQPVGLPQEMCQPSTADYEVIETAGRKYVMLNLINIGFEHSVKVSIDGHKMWIVANDGGFVNPIETDVVYITNAARVTILVKLGSEPGDYAMRIASTSQLQLLQGYALLRYPTKRYPVYGKPMEIPAPRDSKQICLLPDSTVREHCHETDSNAASPFPPTPPPKQAGVMIKLRTGVQESKTEEHVPEYFINEQPWQLFRASMMPLLFQTNLSSLDKPVISGLAVGLVIDLLIENTINETISLYKHGETAYLLGTGTETRFPWSSVEDAMAAGAPLNLIDPPLVLAHDLPPNGWSLVRWRIDSKAATMLHSVKLRYFALGMSAPILEGIIEDDPLHHIPTYAKERPNVEFEPKNNGIFG